MKQSWNTYVQKVAITGLFTAVAVSGSLISFPLFGAKCAPVQHLVNVVLAALLGPWWALGSAFLVSVLRNMMGLGAIIGYFISLSLFQIGLIHEK